MLEHPKYRFSAFAAVVLLGLILALFANAQSSRAASISGLATTPGNANVSADTAANATPSGSWTTVGLAILLPFPMNYDVLIDLAPPTGWQFDTTGSAPTFTGNTCSFDVPVVTATSISTRAAVGQQCNNPNTIAIAGVRVQPVDGATTVTGNLTLTVTSSSGSATDSNVGTLTISPGVMTGFSISNPTLGTIADQYEETAFSVLIRAVDQFGTTTPSYVASASLVAFDSDLSGNPVAITSGGGSVGPFEAGQFSPSLTFDNPHASIYLRVTDNDFAGNSNAFTIQSTATPTAITLTGTPETTYFGDDVILVATVIPENANSPTTQSAPTGVVEFWADETLLGSAELDAVGVATLHYASLPVGFWTLHANYLGSDDYSPSNFKTGVPHEVIKANSMTTVTAPTLMVPGAQFAVSATVGAVSPATGMPTGYANFYDGLVVLGSAILVDGTATLNTSLSALGAHDLRAEYVGDARFLASTSETFTVVIDTNATNLVLTVSSAEPFVGKSVRFTGTILPENATGSVDFYDGSTLLGTSIIAGGLASFTTSDLPAGIHIVSARYLGDTISDPATSNSVRVIVQAVEPAEPPAVDDTTTPTTSTPPASPPTATPVPATPTTVPTSPTTVPTSPNTPPSAPTNLLGAPAPAGATTVAVTGLTGFAIGDRVTINPGGSNEETLTISGLNPLTFTTELTQTHVAGEKLVKAGPPATVEALVPLPPATGTGAAAQTTNPALLLFTSGLTLLAITSVATATMRKRG